MQQGLGRDSFAALGMTEGSAQNGNEAMLGMTLSQSAGMPMVVRFVENHYLAA